jgi:hypothetical protein
MRYKNYLFLIKPQFLNTYTREKIPQVTRKCAKKYALESAATFGNIAVNIIRNSFRQTHINLDQYKFAEHTLSNTTRREKHYSVVYRRVYGLVI